MTASEEERLSNLALFKAWGDSWNLKGWPDITKAGLDRFQVTD